MTAPLRRNGLLVSIIARGCTSKNRYSCQYAARAHGQHQQQESGQRMYIYACKLCKGWHITRNRQRDHTLAADYNFITKGKP